MPAVSVCDSVATAIRHSLDIGKIKPSADDVSLSLTSGASKILQTEIKYEVSDGYQSKVLDQLKSKYTVLSVTNSAEQQKNNGKMNDCNNSIRKKQDEKTKNGPKLPEPSVTLYSPQKIQLGWKGIVPVGAGMFNVGNTCYLNSTLQALFHVPALVNWLLSDSHHNSKCEQYGGAGGECLTCAMSKTLQFSHEKSGNAIKPFYIFNKLKLICRTMIPGQQEDAHEFLRYLLEGMERAYINRHKANKLDSYSKETTPINQIFGGYIRTEVRCLHCHHVSTTFQHFQDLLVDIRKANTLDEALSNYFSREQLDNNDYKCESCKRRVPATKQFTLEKPPKVLCVQLKRFSVLGGKISRHIGFKQTIDMGPYLWRENNDIPCKLNYKLMSIVTHMGPSVNCGHYTAVAQVSTGQYYTFDDSCVRSINFTNVMNTNPYIMIFEMESSERQLPKKLNTINNVKTMTNGNCIGGGGGGLPKQITIKHSPSRILSQNGHTNTEIKPPLLSSSTREPDMPFIGPKLPPPIQSKNTNLMGTSSSSTKLSIDKLQLKNSTSHKNRKALNGNSLVPYDGSSDEDDHSTMKNLNNTSSPNSKLSINNSNGNDNNSKNINGVAKSSPKTEMIESEVCTTMTIKSSASSQFTSNDNYKSNGNGNLIITSTKKTDTNGKDKLCQPTKIKSCLDNKVVTKAKSSINGWEVSKDVPSPTSAATPNGWSVTDNEREDSKKTSHHTTTSSVLAVARNFHGTNRSDAVSHLLKMSNRGYGDPSVTSWNGTRTHMDREVDNERREERKRYYNADDEELDRGKAKKVKSNRDYDGRSNPGYNAFQEYQNGKSWNRLSNGDSGGNYHRRSGNNYYNTSSHNRPRRGGNYKHHYNRNSNYSRDHWQRR